MRWLLILLLVSAAAVLLACRTGKSLELIKRKIRSDFPDVPRLEVEALRARLDRGEVPLLLDVRSADEFAVSHFENARRIEPESDPILGAEVAKDRWIVTYCSVGYRSAKAARALRASGFTNVWNLEGSIFEWAEKGLPLYRGTLQVKVVHPYSPAWEWLVRPELRQYQPKP